MGVYVADVSESDSSLLRMLCCRADISNVFSVVEEAIVFAGTIWKKESYQALLDLVIGLETSDDFLADVAALVQVNGARESGFPWVVRIAQFCATQRDTRLDSVHVPGGFSDWNGPVMDESFPDTRDLGFGAHKSNRVNTGPCEPRYHEVKVVGGRVVVTRDALKKPMSFGTEKLDHRFSGGGKAKLDVFGKDVSIEPLRQCVGFARAQHQQC
jgi:hypothetical protein